jgi:type I restriction enzyme, S subunit
MSNLPKGWKQENLTDYLETIIDYRGKTPEKSDQGILTLSAKSVKMGEIDYSQAYCISQETYNEFMVRGFPKKNDILMTTEAPLGCIAKLDRDDVSVAQRLLTLRGKEGQLDNDYLMYYLMSPIGQFELISRASGSTVQGIKRSEFEKVKIILPSSYDEQKAIANILSSLDNKIELLKEQNKTLETMAQTVFKEWFVNFNYPDATGEMVESEMGEIPKGWRVGRLGEVTNIKGGTTPSTSIKEFWNGEICWSSPKDLSNYDFVFLLDTNKKITLKGLEKISSGLLPKGTLLLSSRAPIGYLAISNVDIAINQGYIALLNDAIFPNHFMYLWLKININLVISSANGSTFMEISKSSFRNIKCLVPNKNVLDDFNHVIKTLFDKLLLNSQQIQTLEKLRDTLLPKLISGKIRVRGFDA